MAKPSRRELLQLAALGAAGAVAGVASAQEVKKPDLAIYEANLAKPLDAVAKEKLAAAVEYAATIRKARMEHKLPENSEPCVRYVPAGSEK